MQQDFYCQAALIEKNNILKFIEGLAAKETIDSNKNETAKDENKGWFKVGLFFANGEAQKLYKKYKSEKGHFKKITLELGFKESDRPYFSETINNSTKNPKNIFKSSKKMKIIIDHCEKNNIPINDDFMSVFNTLQTK
jgi:hypothetical protein